jgi:hypothetical protein
MCFPSGVPSECSPSEFPAVIIYVFLAWSFILYNSSPNIIRVVKSRGIELEGYILRMEDTGNDYKVLV